MFGKHSFRIDSPLATLTLAALAILAPLPSTAQSKSAEKTAKALDAITQGVGAAKSEVEAALKALDGVVNPKNAKALDSNFKEFSKHVDAMVKARDKAHKSAQDFNAEKEDYLKNWNKEMQDVSNPDIRSTMEARQAKITEVLEGLRPAFETAKQSFEPFLSDLVDTQKMLAMDLSSSAVEAASPVTSKAMTDGKTVIANLDEVIKALGDVKQQMQ